MRTNYNLAVHQIKIHNLQRFYSHKSKTKTMLIPKFVLLGLKVCIVIIYTIFSYWP